MDNANVRCGECISIDTFAGPESIGVRPNHRRLFVKHLVQLYSTSYCRPLKKIVFHIRAMRLTQIFFSAYYPIPVDQRQCQDNSRILLIDLQWNIISFIN